MRVKAIILILIFLFGGNGFSVDISKCCDDLAGISLGFAKSETHKSDASCCPVFKTVKPRKLCCENVVINTVINHVPGLTKAYKPLQKPITFDFNLQVIASSVVSQEGCSYRLKKDGFDSQYPIPILLKKRVLTI